MRIRAATAQDVPGIWDVLESMIRPGETYPLPRDMSREDALAYWFSAAHDVFIAEDAGAIVESRLRQQKLRKS